VALAPVAMWALTLWATFGVTVVVAPLVGPPWPVVTLTVGA
jgi:hypothetical protein